MKVYIATRFGDYEKAQRVHGMLFQAGHEPTSSWVAIADGLNGECERVEIGDPQRIANASHDLEDIDRSDALLVLVPEEGGTGMWIELGYALWRDMDRGDIRILCVGPALARSVFCELCEVYDSVNHAIAALDGGTNERE